jgi:cytochrome c biogenesis factor
MASLKEMGAMRLRTSPWAITAIALLAAMVVVWPELFVFQKFIILPEWAKRLPSPVDAGVYLATPALALVAWGPRDFMKAFVSTLTVALAAAGVAATAYAFQKPWDDWLVMNAAFSFVWVFVARLLPPALALLALRWAVRTWTRL